MEPILTTADCVAFLGVTRQTIQKADQIGGLTSVPTSGKVTYFTAASLLAYAERNGKKLNRKSVEAVGKARQEELALKGKAELIEEELKGIRARIAAILAKLG